METSFRTISNTAAYDIEDTVISPQYAILLKPASPNGPSMGPRISNVGINNRYPGISIRLSIRICHDPWALGSTSITALANNISKPKMNERPKNLSTVLIYHHHTDRLAHRIINPQRPTL